MIPAYAPPHTMHELLKAASSLLTIKDVKEEFESRMKSHLKTDNYLTTGSGRRALYIALKSSGICKDEEIILPAFTTDIVPMVVREIGAIPIPADARCDDYNIDIDSVLDRISHKTKAILAVHTFGSPSDLKALKDICNDHNIYLIEDAAPALGAKYHGKPVGTTGDFGIMSFGIGKSISMGGGGGLIVSDDELFKRVKNAKIAKIKHTGFGKIFIKIAGSIMLSNPHLYGSIGHRVKEKIVSNQYDGYTKDITNDYDIPILSYAIGIEEMKSKIFERRREIAMEYTDILKNFDNIYPPVEKKDTYAVYSRYFVRIESEDKRNKICKRMIASRIEPLMPDHGYPISKRLYPKRFQHKIPIADILSRSLVGVPVHLKISEDIINTIFK